MTAPKKRNIKTSDKPTTALSRRDARQRAISILYESKIKEISAIEIADDEGKSTVDPLTYYLIEGVGADLEAIDSIIGRLSTNWTFDRLPLVERCILEIAIFELLDTSNNQAIVINEAVELVRRLGEPKSTSYINGILSTVAAEYLVKPDQSPSSIHINE